MSTALALEDPARRAWLDARRKHITSTDASAILGLVPWSGPLNVFSRKLGLDPEPEATERMELGSALQAPVAELFGRRTGRSIAHVEPFVLVRHPTIDWLATSLDAFQIDDKKGRGLLEVKLSEQPWSEEPPARYQVQLQHELLVTGAKWGTLCCLVRGAQLVHVDYDADEKFQKALIAVLSVFWHECLLKHEPPMTIGKTNAWDHPMAKDALRALYPQDSGVAIELPEEALPIASAWDDLDAQLRAANANVKELQRRKDSQANRLKLWMKDAEMAVLPDGTGFRWHSFPKMAYEVAASVQRNFTRTSSIAVTKHLKGR